MSPSEEPVQARHWQLTSLSATTQRSTKYTKSSNPTFRYTHTGRHTHTHKCMYAHTHTHIHYSITSLLYKDNLPQVSSWPEPQRTLHQSTGLRQSHLEGRDALKFAVLLSQHLCWLVPAMGRDEEDRCHQDKLVHFLKSWTGKFCNCVTQKVPVLAGVSYGKGWGIQVQPG